jgi:putative drug exporter of the RND superfamily
VREAVAQLRRRALATGELRNPITVRASDDHAVTAISIGLAGSGTDRRSEQALELLRTWLVPGTLGAVSGVEAHVGGLTAESKDFNDQLKRRAPLVFAFVPGLAFLLLLTAFRSVVVAAKAVVLNLLSVGAAYGLLVALFQWGWGESLLGFESTGGHHFLAAALPVHRPLRPLDGLPRVHPRAGPRGGRPRAADG